MDFKSVQVLMGFLTAALCVQIAHGTCTCEILHNFLITVYCSAKELVYFRVY